MSQDDRAKNIHMSVSGGRGGSGGAGGTNGGGGGTGEGPSITINSPTGKIVIEGDSLKKVLHEWLAPPNMSDRQYELQKLHHGSTGSWLLNDFRFKKWKTTPGFLWINGISGTGKSVLSSMVIGKITEAYSSRCAVTYFFFDFRNKIQQMDTMLRSLTWQLSGKASSPYSALSQLYETLGNGTIQPQSEHLQKALKNILLGLDKTYIVIDALDECNRASWQPLVKFVCSLSCPTLHFLFTSQPLGEFNKGFWDIPSIKLDSTVTSRDIRTFIGSQVPGIENWASHNNHTKVVTEQIVRKSNGMFRLAACLLIELSHCYWEHDWEKTLMALPSDLFGIYNHFWARALDVLRKPVFIQAIFQWLVFSAREVTSDELADAVAFDLDDPTFDFSKLDKSAYHPERYSSNCDAFKLLEGLIVLRNNHSAKSIALAHSSVKDYILSPEFQQEFKTIITKDISHKFITQTCVRYLMIFADPKYSMSKDTCLSYPMALYAGNFWFRHLQLCNEQDQEALLASTIDLMETGSRQYMVLYQSYQSGYSRMTHVWNEPMLSPLSMCSEIGYTRGVWFLLSKNNTFVDEVTENGETALHLASKKGHFDIVQLLIKHNALIDLCTNNGQTALHLAFENNHWNIIKLLLDHNASVDLPIKDGATALHLASQKGYLDIVQLLIKHNASVDLYTNSGKTALHLASWNNHFNIVQLLLDHNASVDLATKYDETALYLAFQKGYLDIVQLLIKHNASIGLHMNNDKTALYLTLENDHLDIVKLLDHNASINGQTILHLASQEGYLDIVQLLIKRNISVDLCTNEGETALHIASWNNRFNIVQLLVNYNASVDLATKYGETALHLASQQGYLHIVQLLLNQNASVNLATKNGDTALHFASQKGYLDIVKLLIEHNASVDLCTNDGETALHIASWNNCFNIVQLLLDHNASVDLATKNGETALHFASHKGHLDMVQLLIKYNIFVDLRTNNGKTALYLASQKGFQDIVQLLIKHNASIDLCTNDGKTALHIASWNNHFNIVQLLVNHNTSVDLVTKNSETVSEPDNFIISGPIILAPKKPIILALIDRMDDKIPDKIELDID